MSTQPFIVVFDITIRGHFFQYPVWYNHGKEKHYQSNSWSYENSQLVRTRVIAWVSSLTHWRLTRPKAVWPFSGKGIIGKIIEGEMLRWILSTTLLQIFCKIIPNLLSIVEIQTTISREAHMHQRSLHYNSMSSFTIWGGGGGWFTSQYGCSTLHPHSEKYFVAKHSTNARYMLLAKTKTAQRKQNASRSRSPMVWDCVKTESYKHSSKKCKTPQIRDMYVIVTSVISKN